MKAFKGKIFYSLKEDEDTLSPLVKAKRVHEAIFGGVKIAKPYNDNLKNVKKGIMFIRIRKNQVHYLTKLPNAYHAFNYYKVMLSRKHDEFVKFYRQRNLNNELESLPKILEHTDFHTLIPEIGEAFNIINAEIEENKSMFNNSMFDHWNGLTTHIIEQQLNISYDSKECNTFKSTKAIKILVDFMKKNEDTLKLFRIRTDEPFTEKLVMLLDLALER
jgi:hypothetical protein